MELSFALLPFARAFSQTPTMIIKYVSNSGSCISWPGVVCHRSAFSKNAGWLRKVCPEANQSMEVSYGLLTFSGVFLRLPSLAIKYVFHRASNRRAGFRVFLTPRPLFFGPARPLGRKSLSRSKPNDGSELWTSNLIQSVPTVA